METRKSYNSCLAGTLHFEEYSLLTWIPSTTPTSSWKGCVCRKSVGVRDYHYGNGECFKGRRTDNFHVITRFSNSWSLRKLSTREKPR
jgi:hypothetical protein